MHDVPIMIINHIYILYQSNIKVKFITNITKSVENRFLEAIFSKVLTQASYITVLSESHTGYF